MKVSIILVNYNGKQFNKDCINSLLAQTYQDFEIIFVDNASTDDSLIEVENIFIKEIESGKIKIIKNKENTGFTGGNNLGHKKSSGEYICLLNNDTTVQNNWLEELIKGIEKDKELGAVGSIILDKGYEEEILDFYLNKKNKFILTHFGDTDIYKASEIDINKNIYYTNAISGCCFLYRKCIIDFPFPEFYFAYGEEAFLSLVIQIKGFKLGIIPNSKVYHFGSGSFGKKPNINKIKIGTRNLLINFFLFHTKKEFILLLPLLIIYHILNSLFNYQHIRFLGKLLAIFSFLKNINKIMKLKRYINKLTNYKSISHLLSYKLVEKYYLLKIDGLKYKIIYRLNNFYKNYFDLFKIKYFK